MGQNEDEPTVGQLVANASRDLSSLVRSELELAKTELKKTAVAAGTGAGMFGAAAFLALLAIILLSIAAAYGVTVLVWQEGFGSDLLFGQPATGVITTWVPIAAFAFLFGLSMDYEVFILARMREAYDEHGDTDRAVVDGISHTGRLVTSAALILFLSFVALSTVPSVEVKILATTLALGILLDAVVVRGLLAPALVAALGHLNWTMPGLLRRVLRVPESPASGT